MQYVKCVIVGDKGVGKTSMLMEYMTNRYSLDYIPSVFPNTCTARIEVDSNQVALGLSDTTEEGDYNDQRLLSYPQTDVFIVCFSISNPTSFANVKWKWFPELWTYSPGTPIIIVGTKADQRDDHYTISRLKEAGVKLVTQEQASEMAKELKGVSYVECSSLTKAGLKGVFVTAARAALNPPSVKKSKICQLT